MLSVGVLYGGRSGEHDVSLCSAASIVTALNPERYTVVAIGIDRDGRWYVQDRPTVIQHPEFGSILAMEKNGTWLVNHFDQDAKLTLYDVESGKRCSVDLVIPAVHGTYCEDGTLQGLLELARVPFVGADTLGSAVAMDKDVTKRLLRDGGIPVVPWITVTRTQWSSQAAIIAERILAELALPLFVKPARTGSSVGVYKVKVAGDLRAAVDASFAFDTTVIVETGIPAREIECAVLGNDDPIASILGEIVPHHEFYSYEAKYLDPNGADLVIPARVDDELAAQIRKAAIKGYLILNCSGMARMDFFLDRENGRFYLNEINTLPGFTSISMYPKLWRETGISYERLLDRLIELALERHRMKLSVSTERR